MSLSALVGGRRSPIHPRLTLFFQRLRRFSGARRVARALGAGAGFAAALGLASPAAAGLVRDSEIERTLYRMTAPVFEAADIPVGEVRIFLIADRNINAFVTSARAMFLNTGLIMQLETPEQLLGVVAHEAGHIKAGHIISRRRAIENARIQSIFASIIGVGAAAAGAGVGGLGVAAGGQSIITRDLLKFTRGQEASADQSALIYLNRAGIDPTGMLEVLAKLQQNQAIYLSNVDPYVLSHPLSGQRIALLQRGVAESPARGRRVSEDTRYWHARMRAKLDGFLSAPGSRPLVSYGSEEIDLYREAISLHRLPAPDRAIAAMDRLISMRPQDPFYWEMKGQFLRESGRGADAVAPYRRAVELAPGEALIRGGLGEALLALDDPAADAEALSMLTRAAADDPFDAGIRRALALAYARNGDDGMAAVVTAERLALTGRLSEAQRQARRAQQFLPVGSPGWLRAEEILNTTID